MKLKRCICMRTNIIILFAALFCCYTFSHSQENLDLLSWNTIDSTFYESGEVRTIEMSKTAISNNQNSNYRKYTYKSIYCYDECGALRLISHFDYSKDHVLIPVKIQSCWMPKHFYRNDTTFDNKDCNKIWIRPLNYW